MSKYLPSGKILVRVPRSSHKYDLIFDMYIYINIILYTEIRHEPTRTDIRPPILITGYRPTVALRARPPLWVLV